MKFLLAIMVSTMFTASAFAACDINKVAECKVKQDCEALSNEGRKFVFNEKDTKCEFKDTVQATKCTEGSDTTLAVDKSSAGKDDKAAGKGAIAK